jgi:hypothetical protein
MAADSQPRDSRSSMAEEIKKIREAGGVQGALPVVVGAQETLGLQTG